MTPVLLLKELVQFLRSAVDDYAATKGESGEYRVPEVFDWYLPFKSGRDAEKTDFPYVTAKIVDIEETDDQQRVTVILSFGVYHDGIDDNADRQRVHPDGAYDLLNLMEHVRQSLYRKGIINRQFRLKKPYKAHIPEEQPYPLWVGQAITTWELPPIKREVPIIYD
ncbi:hypothetical protein ACFOQM_12445 [Paenibacillus sp. GCM10012307]|uniref:Uncharacterized protein n=1 Tax=Paenibacillus roseus TaxID=2798579 RepID=A0A934IZI5_9BACL|nr:hypothetical protein [Paenibacillus roseus]MBJ6362101.1 hypothetical protein [Paenibacillus roseus]